MVPSVRSGAGPQALPENAALAIKGGLSWLQATSDLGFGKFPDSLISKQPWEKVCKVWEREALGL